jgi:hypothetical protein
VYPRQCRLLTRLAGDGRYSRKGTTHGPGVVARVNDWSGPRDYVSWKRHEGQAYCEARLGCIWDRVFAHSTWPAIPLSETQIDGAKS